MESLWYWLGKAFPIRHSVCSTSRINYASNGIQPERALRPRKKSSAKTSELTTGVNPLCECSVPGCTEAFDSFSDHNNKQLPSKSVHDRVRRDYAAEFASVDVAQKTSPVTLSSSSETPNRQPLEMGWAINKTHTASTRFSKKVKEYLTGKSEKELAVRLIPLKLKRI